MFCDKRYSWKFRKTLRKTPVPGSLFCKLIKKEALAQVFFYEFCEIFKSHFFTEHPRTTAFVTSLLKSFFLNIFCPFEQLFLLFLFIEIRFSTKADASTNKFKEITFFTSSCHAIAILLIHKKILFHSWFPVNMKY